MTASPTTPVRGAANERPGTHAATTMASTTAPGARRKRKRVTPGKVVQHITLWLMFVLLAGPLAWQISMSLRGPGENVFSRPPRLIPAEPTLANFSAVLDRLPVLSYIGNSVTVAAMTVSGNIIFATLAGFALARLRFRGRAIATAILLSSMLIPLETILISRFLLIRDMGFQDSLVGVALPGLVSALSIFLMRNAFAGIPKELEEAARIDGANTWQRFLRVCVPQVKGTITAVAVMAFVAAWNDFLWPLIVLSDDTRFTLTVGLQRLRGTFFDDPRLIAAGTIVAVVPIIVFFALLQRYFFKGLESGGVKG